MKAKYVIPLIALLSTISCNHEDPSVGGCGYTLAADELSQNGLVFDAQAQMKTAEAGGEMIQIIDEAADKIVKALSPEPNSDSVSVLEYDWITIWIPLRGDLIISVKENTTGKDREVGVELQSGNCFGTFYVTQKAATE